jgi:predicted ABC-type ATPase
MGGARRYGRRSLRREQRGRSPFIEARQSFVAETVFSHESKLELVRKALSAGFRVVLYHVNVRKPEFSVACVQARGIAWRNRN